MKVIHPTLLNYLLIPAVVGCLLVAGLTKSHADSDDRSVSAQAMARTWIAQIDAGKYDDSYADSSNALQQKIPQDRWVAVLRALRPIWGGVVSRKEISHIYKPNGIEQEHLGGECMLITYDTSFKNLESATEVVVLQWEGGKWRGAGYNAGPKPSDDQTPSTATSSHPQTEISTQNVKAPPR